MSPIHGYGSGRNRRVSIPFKREGSFRVEWHCALGEYMIVSIPFKREGSFREWQNPHAAHRVSVIVSIPFKREGSFRVESVVEIPLRNKFQFPSNGKAHSEASHWSWPFCKWVSIPFKREGSFRVEVYGRSPYTAERTQFQFPSNGKAHSERPHFAPSGAVGPYPQNPTRTARGFFYT